MVRSGRPWGAPARSYQQGDGLEPLLAAKREALGATDDLRSGRPRTATRCAPLAPRADPSERRLRSWSRRWSAWWGDTGLPRLAPTVRAGTQTFSIESVAVPIRVILYS